MEPVWIWEEVLSIPMVQKWTAQSPQLWELHQKDQSELQRRWELSAWTEQRVQWKQSAELAKLPDHSSLANQPSEQDQ